MNNNKNIPQNIEEDLYQLYKKGLEELKKPSKEIRCQKCKRLLMKGTIIAIEIKCPKCGYIQIFSNIP